VFGDFSAELRKARNRSTGPTETPSSPRTVHDTASHGITTRCTRTEHPRHLRDGRRKVTTSTTNDAGQETPVAHVKDSTETARDNTEGLRPEPGLVRDRRPGLRPPGLDAAARPDRDRPPLGTEKAPPAPVLRRRAARARRTPPAAPPRPTMALGLGHHRRGHPPAGPLLRLNSRNRHYDQERTTPGAAGPRPPGATAGQPRTTRPGNHPPANTSGQHISGAKDRG
jgi:hypothetical protein